MRAHDQRDVARYDTWRGILWTLVIAGTFYWLAYPWVYTPLFDDALRYSIIVVGVGVLLTLPRWHLPRPAMSVLCVLILGFASTLWSINAGVTFSYTLRAAAVALLATVVAAYADSRTVAHGLALGGTLVVGISLWAYAHDVHGSHSIYVAGVAGVVGNRNVLASTLLMALPFAVSFIPRRRWGRLLWAGGIMTILGGLLIAQSATGIIAGFLVALAAVSLKLVDRRRLRHGVVSQRRPWAHLALASTLLVAGVLAFEMVTRVLGRDLGTLSGRVPLWKAILANTDGRDRLIGDGWGAVWPHPWFPAPRNSDWLPIVAPSRLPLPHGHNSFLDLYPELGLLGIVVFALTYVHGISNALRLRDPNRAATSEELHASRVGLLGVLALLLAGLTEPLSTNPLGWFVTVMLATGFVVPAARSVVVPRDPV